MEEDVIPEYDIASIYPNFKCLSSSQFLTYEKDPQQFYMEYVIGVKRQSDAMLIGSLFSACYENRNINPVPLLSMRLHCKKDFIDLFIAVLKSFPVQRGGHPEYPLKCEFMGWEFRATLDDYIEDTMTNIENKTGKVLWDKDRVNFSDQITFQSWVHWKAKGVPFRRIILNWWNTGKKTRDVRTFKTSRSLKNLKEFEKRVENVIKNLEAKNFTNPIY